MEFKKVNRILSQRGKREEVWVSPGFVSCEGRQKVRVWVPERRPGHGYDKVLHFRMYRN